MVTGKLYDTKGKRIEDHKAVVTKIRYFPQTVSEPKGSEEPDMLEVLDTSEEKFITRVIGMAIREESKGEDIPTKVRRFTRSHS